MSVLPTGESLDLDWSSPVTQMFMKLDGDELTDAVKSDSAKPEALANTSPPRLEQRAVIAF